MLVIYREFAPPVRVASSVVCVWEQEPTQTRVQRVVPDGCVDLIWFAERELIVAGADTGPRTVVLPALARSSGIRLRPGAAGAVLGMAASEVRDRNVAADLVWGTSDAAGLSEALAAATPRGRLRLLADAVQRRGAQPDELVLAAARRLRAPDARVATVAMELGVSERQLHRRTVAAVGYGPKVLARVARLRRLVAVREEELGLRALRAGYASQAHMNEEVRRLTGLTPVRFLEDAALTAA
ncbi:MAG TPA: DUF6597 domain-containing transcriptional factor [Gemmatimonadaceae bacterium]|nr:DUF6597 domain-containing transcriptional factor [Gemmatimonadaceae bacterium]